MKHAFFLPAALAALFLLAPVSGEAQVLDKLMKKTEKKTEKKTDRKSTQTAKSRKASGPVAFNADDPFDPVNFVTEGTPWEDVTDAVPEALPAVAPDPLPDIGKISNIAYNAAVSVAFESLRIVYGEMSDEDAEAFQEMWAPLYDHPTQEIIDYLNKLNPLLSQFLMARESYMRSLACVENLMFDAGEAVDWDDREAYEDVMREMDVYIRDIKALDAAMSDIAARIWALGNPPNPLLARAEARRRYNSAFSPKDQEVYIGETWMGTRVSHYDAPGLDPLTEPLMRYLFKAKVNGENRYFVVQLEESGIPDKDDEEGLRNMKVVQYGYADRGDKVPDFKSDGTFQKYYPKPPVMAITMLTMNLMRQFELSDVTDEDEENGTAGRKQAYHDAAGNFGNRVLWAGFFFKAGMEWSIADKWNQYAFDSGEIPKETLEDFTEAVRQCIRKEMADRKKSRKQRKAEAAAQEEALAASPEAIRARQIQDSLAFEEKSRQESIASRKEIIAGIQSLINREREIRSREVDRLNAAKSESERSSIRRTIEDIDYRIIHYQSDLQSEQDNIRSLETGRFVHTRSAFDEYAFTKMIRDSQIEAIRSDRTKRAASIIEKQIKRLPASEQDEAWKRAERILYDEGALAKGDFEKVRALGSAFHNKLTGEALKDQAEAEEAVAWADLKEAGANAVIMACGSVTVGLAGEALAATYGTGTAATIWGTRLVGAVYGGVTGYVAGGPGKSVSSAANYFHPVTSAVASFVEGYSADGNAGKTVPEKIWEGVKQTGKDYLIGKAFEIGSSIFVKTATAICPKLNARFVPTKQEKLDMLRTQRARLEAQDAVNSFKRMNNEYVEMLAKGNTPQATLDAARKNINQMAASLNADYHAKWFFKYKADPTLRAHFDQAVQANYRNMTPKMTESLTAQGYDMKDIDFKQFRNSSSAGSSSMDLDLAPVSRTTGKEPVFLKNGKEVDAATFMKDAQQTMNTVYRAEHHISAKASEMNLTTSAHPEAYKTPALLEKNVDFSKLSADEIASVGKVLDVKVKSIEGNVRYTQTTITQAKCREATKELDNMLIPKLKQELKASKTGKEAAAISEKLTYWTDMRDKLRAIGTSTNDPVAIHKMNHQIQQATGGKDATQVVNDLIREFNPSFKVE